MLRNSALAAAAVLAFVGASATLGGTGIVGGAITVNGGGTLAPGESIGTLTANSGAAFADNSIFAVELDSSASSSDTLVSFGATTMRLPI